MSTIKLLSKVIIKYEVLGLEKTITRYKVDKRPDVDM